MTITATISGREIDILKPMPEDFLQRDIVYQLAFINRWGGASLFPISIAQHSLLVWTICTEAKAPPEVRLWALLHDAHEMVLGEIPTPSKQALFGTAEELPSAFDDMANGIDFAVAKAFGLRPERLQVIAPAVAKADLIAAATEWRDAKPGHPPAHWPAPHPTRVTHMNPGRVMDRFDAAINATRALV